MRTRTADLYRVKVALCFSEEWVGILETDLCPVPKVAECVGPELVSDLS